VTDFEQLYRTYFRDVYRYLRRLSGDERMAEELTSDTFFKAMQSIHSFRGECDLRVWLCQIAKNTYYSHRRAAKKTVSMDQPELCDLPDPTPGVAEDYLRKEELSRIQIILHEMDDPYKEVFLWRVYAELSFKQIAQIFGKTDNWACVTYHRARKMILERLEEQKNENGM